MAARAGSPARAATSAIEAVVTIACLLSLTHDLITRRRGEWFDRGRSIRPYPDARPWATFGVFAMTTRAARFYGWTVVAGAFVVAVFGWGVGFYGPPIFLKAVRDIRGWSVA